MKQHHTRPLWAPWRIQYIRNPKDENCFFCQKAACPEQDGAQYVIHRGEVCFVLLNMYPYNSGHLLIAPYRHVAKLSLLTPAERTEMLELLCRAETALEKAMQPEGSNIGCNQGRIAGAAVEDHLHWHVVPRWLGDTSFMPVIGGSDSLPEALDATAELLRRHWPEK